MTHDSFVLYLFSETISEYFLIEFGKLICRQFVEFLHPKIRVCLDSD